MRVAIIGAGISGLACAEALEEAGIPCALFDKGSRPGGRMSSVEFESMAWDFGAQYFTVASDGFARQVARWEADGIVAPWPEGPKGAFVGIPAMSNLVAAQCSGRHVRFGTRVQRLDYDAAGWMLVGSDFAEGPFDAVIVSVPPEQAIPLLTLHDFELARQYVNVRSQPCWTILVGFDEVLSGLPDFIEQRGPIGWAARNNSKPGRPDGECWVIQADRDWSLRHLELRREEAAVALLDAFREAVAPELPRVAYLKGHRWRFALATPRTGHSAWNEDLSLGVCGDWCVTPQVEGAWRSGKEVAARLLATHARPGQMRATA